MSGGPGVNVRIKQGLRKARSQPTSGLRVVPAPQSVPVPVPVPMPVPVPVLVLVLVLGWALRTLLLRWGSVAQRFLVHRLNLLRVSLLGSYLRCKVR